MEKCEIRFERDPSLDRVEIVVRAPEETAEVDALLERLAHVQTGSLVVFSGSGRVRTLAPEEIVTATVEDKLVRVITEDGSWFSRQSLQSLEEQLDPRRFVRVSRFELVNLGKVRQYDFTIAGTLRLELVGGMETWASRRCIPEIRKRLSGKEG